MGKPKSSNQTGWIVSDQVPGELLIVPCGRLYTISTRSRSSLMKKEAHPWEPVLLYKQLPSAMLQLITIKGTNGKPQRKIRRYIRTT
jgi:hypothetical protein